MKNTRIRFLAAAASFISLTRIKYKIPAPHNETTCLKPVVLSKESNIYPVAKIKKERIGMSNKVFLQTSSLLPKKEIRKIPERSIK